MTIRVECSACGKVLKAKDSAAGKRAKCPQCGEIITIPDAFYEDYGDDDIYDAEEADDEYGFDDVDEYASPAAPPSNRKPCPACGEMIIKTAAKCRFCGEIFDASLRKRERRRSSVDSDSEMLTSDWLICILCPGIGCIAGIVYLIQGKPKAGKFIGVSLVFIVLWNVIRLALLSVH